MAYARYERLTATDATFLALEDASVHMHVGAVAIFEGGPLRAADGSIDLDRLQHFTAAALHDTPRFRQKLASIPWTEQPVWVDDERFNLAYHLRHTALPAPGDERQLKRLAGRILSQKLDRGKPLWEMWLVEGVSDDRVALVVKAHHCMVDGIAGMDLMAALLRLEPVSSAGVEKVWLPQPAPSRAQLLRDEVVRRASLPFSLLRSAPDALSQPRETLRSLVESGLSLAETMGAALVPATPTPLNPEIGPYRRFDWGTLDLEQVKEIRKHLGGTLNDVVLCTVAGAVRSFLDHRGMRVTPETIFRVMVPVSIRTASERGVPGNRVVNFLARLPVDERDPRRRLARTIETTEKLKRSRLVKGAEVLEEIADRAFPRAVTQFVRLGAEQLAFNMVVTNVPGPPRPLYLLGAKLQEIFPVVPLFTSQGLGIALFSYDGRLHWGFNADWDALPDLHDFVGLVEEHFARLLDAARSAGAA